MLELEAGDVRVLISEDDGGRLASMRVHGRELLVEPAPGRNAFHWGAFPMVPWVGRIRHGRFDFDGRRYQLPINFETHAIHGTTFDRRWRVQANGSLVTDFGADWPFGGHAVQRFALEADELTCTLEVHAHDRAMPAQAGWHPWWVKPVELRFQATEMYVKDSEGIPTGALATPEPGPWDDCFRGVEPAPQLTWADGLTLTIQSSCDHWVVFDRPASATCVEPQTGPPDGFTLAPQRIEPGDSLVATMTLRWT